MKFTNADLLEAQVATRNSVNQTANKLQLRLTDLLRPYIGQKIIKTTPYRSATKKISTILDPIQAELHLRGFRLVFDWSFQYTVYATLDKTYRVSESAVDYVKRDIYICLIRDGILEGFREFEPARTDYTAEEVTETRKKIAALEKQVSDLKSSITEFSR